MGFTDEELVSFEILFETRVYSEEILNSDNLLVAANLNCYIESLIKLFSGVKTVFEQK